MRIKKKEWQGHKVLYTVQCPQCGVTFQSGKNPNLWRTLRGKYNASKRDIVALQREAVETAMRGEIPQVKDMGSILFVNHHPVYKRRIGNQHKRKNR